MYIERNRQRNNDEYVNKTLGLNMYTHNIYSTLSDQDLRTTFTSTIQLYSFVSHKSIFCLGVQNLDILEE